MSSCGSDIHFFKKIEEDTLRHGELRIPRNFVSKYWEGISNPVLIQLPNGANWQVNWKKLDADVWLIDEWKDFAELYCLDQDHLLVFKYVGSSQFQVVIFDQNGLEIGYPLIEGRTFHHEVNSKYLSHRKRAKFPLPISGCTKKVKTNPREEPNCYPSQDAETILAHTDPFDHGKPKKRGRKKILHGNKRYSKSKAIQTPLCALERAKAFMSENPFFIQEMHPSYLQSCYLSMPRNFITEDQRNEDNSVTLWMSEERNWRVKFSVNRRNGQNILSTGWKNFVKDNNLKKGDVCVFEKIKKPGISFNVVIFPSEEPSTSMFPGCEFRRYNNNKVSENHFTLSIKSKQLYHKSIPLKFIRHHNIGNRKMVTLQNGKRSWLVKLECYSEYNVCRFTSGWSAFMRECNLKAGDICYFELIDMKEVVFQVTITKRIN